MRISQRCLSGRTSYIKRCNATLVATRAIHRKRDLAFARSSCSHTLHQDAIFCKSGSTTWIRGAKTKTSVKITPLHQGALPQGTPVAVEREDGPAYPAVIQGARNNMKKFAHCVVLTRVGGFYELYFEQAEEYGPLLNLKVGKKSTNAGIVPMSGFPFFQLDRFLKILVQDLNKHVAIVEEFEKDAEAKAKSGGLQYDRRVSRIITPGTLIDENFMDPFENNYLLSIQCDPEILEQRNVDAENSKTPEVGLAWLDLSSGDFFTQRTNLDALGTVLARIAPREILLDQALQDLQDKRLTALCRDDRHIITYITSVLSDLASDNWLSMIEAQGERPAVSNFSALEIAAGNTILHYVNTQLQGTKPRLQAPLQRREDEFMALDKNTIRALEIRETLRDGTFQGSLLHAVRRTVTKSGSRLLGQRLCLSQAVSPSMSLDEINSRLDLVAEFLENPDLHHNLLVLLRDTFDSLRLVQKFSFGRGDADDLLGLSRTIQVTDKISDTLWTHQASGEQISTAKPRWLKFESLLHRLSLDGPMDLSLRILNTIDEEKLMEQHRIEDSEAAEMVELAEDVLNQEGEQHLKGVPKSVRAQAHNGNGIGKSVDAESNNWIMQRNASAMLSRLHRKLDALKEEKDSLESRLRIELGAASLTLRWTPKLGHICHVKGGVKERASVAALRSVRILQSSKSTQSFHVPEWTQLGNRTEEAKHRIQAEESRIFATLRAEVVRNLIEIRRNAAVLDELDVACSSATLAREQRLVRPILNAGMNVNIVGGRHHTVEAGLMKQGRNFTSNDLSMTDAERIHLITGPNMGGKSTFLRQNALICILAQTGSYVPAEYAEIGLVDKIFSRVGSADNLYADQSTFMVEMLETAEILRSATPRSFVVMDEVGRGTTPEDGVAVGFAALHHLYHVNKSRVLFATHFHTLTDMVQGVEGIACYCTDVAESREGDGSWTFVHRLRRGVNRESHALKVAGLAGLPKEAVEVAAKVLRTLQNMPPLPPPNLPDPPLMALRTRSHRLTSDSSLLSAGESA
ncbi:DNA mismatch repair protein muts [Rhizodiscina lignyota]|uniref:DNA mismatch repair protein muts n=1 Tax=Rhizodiscina lignyota TaxID=1504668 RepID=A0A9P4M7A7_9PEZI|nr:DNA mismatch repair protein muts [Rhizodiscina lignyota]